MSGQPMSSEEQVALEAAAGKAAERLYRDESRRVDDGLGEHLHFREGARRGYIEGYEDMRRRYLALTAPPGPHPVLDHDHAWEFGEDGDGAWYACALHGCDACISVTEYEQRVERLLSEASDKPPAASESRMPLGEAVAEEFRRVVRKRPMEDEACGEPAEVAR